MSLSGSAASRPALWPDYLITHQHIGDAAVDHGLGLRHLLAADSHRPCSHLARRDHGALVRLGVRAQSDACTTQTVGHLRHIALERIEVYQQRRRFHVVQAHARLGRWQLTHRNLRLCTSQRAAAHAGVRRRPKLSGR
jgi:hypothetical protein